MVLRFSQLMRLCLCLLFLGIQSIYATDHKDDKKPSGGGAVPVVQHTSSLTYQTSFAANRHLVSPESNTEAAIITEEALAEKEKAKGVFDELDRTNKYIDDIIDKDLQVLPIGFKKTVGNGKVEVAVSRAEFYSQYAELTMYVRMTIPGEGGKEKILFLTTSSGRIEQINYWEKWSVNTHDHGNKSVRNSKPIPPQIGVWGERDLKYVLNLLHPRSQIGV